MRHQQQHHLPDDLCEPSAPSSLGAPDVAERLRVLERENRQLKVTVRRLRQLAFVDGLTGLPNRRHFDTALHAEIGRACRAGAPLGLAICDVDFFKQVNDEFGHAAGDTVLRVLSRIFDVQCRRGGDLAARYGGEEFGLLMPGLDSNEMLAVAEKVRASVAETLIPCGRDGRWTQVTVSIGVTSFKADIPCLPARLVQAADTALYRVKRNGRNGVRYEAISGGAAAACGA